MTSSAYRLSSGEAGASRASRATRTRARDPVRAREQPTPEVALEPEPEPNPEPEPRRPSRVARVLGKLESLAMLGGSIAAAAVLLGAWESSQSDATVIPGVRLAGIEIGGLDRTALEEVAREAGQQTLDRELTLRAGPVTTTTTARALGSTPEPSSAIDEALAFGRSGELLADLHARAQARAGAVDLRVGMRFDDRLALAQLLELAPDVDTMSLPTRLDLEARKVLPAQRGTALLPYDALSSVALGLAGGAEIIELPIAHKPPVADPLGEIADGLDIGVVLGSFSTPYSMEGDYGDRTANLKVGAAALDGTVIQPGEQFSFNAVVGDRGVENGYRFATGIAGGQLVDTVGGGICQIASTVFGASFFAGLDIIDARPHSRPSGYVDMGLDATVVWDSVDLVLRNPYEFPIVVHMSVSQGQVHAEILGPQRPYQIAFERTLKEALPYETVHRSDPNLRTGAQVVAQRGMRGFKLERVRKFHRGGKVEREESWEIEYPPTREIIRIGTNPTGELPEKKSLPALRDPASSMRIMQ
ncbi:MAG TPA: VanW family protein [Enhygromyxa sp.]|nr:VanW family protein [Enhygromyxa sp.]